MKKKSLKKAAVLAIAGAMAVTSLAACGGSGSGKDSEGGSSDSLTMAWWGNQVRNERTQQALDAYKEESGITVSGQFYQWGDYWSKMATSAAGKKMPDVIQMDMSYIQQYVDKGQLLDLTPYIEDGTLDTSNISEDIVNMGKVGDGIYGIAAGTSASCMFYNKTLLDELGITINDNMTLDEFIDISKQVYEETGYRSNLYHYGLYMDMYARANDIQASDKLGGDSADDYLPYFETLETGIELGEETGCTALISSHSLRELEDICSGFALLDGGSVADAGDLTETLGMVHKYQFALDRPVRREDIPFPCISFEATGRVAKVIARGEKGELEEKLLALSPLFVEELKVDFEELFLCEVRSRGYLK